MDTTSGHSAIPHTHKRTIHPAIQPCIHPGREPAERAAPTPFQTHNKGSAARSSDQRQNRSAWRGAAAARCAEHFFAQTCQKEKKNLSLPSRSHNCMASRLRSLIIPSQGLNGLVMLCAKPGTSISAERSG